MAQLQAQENIYDHGKNLTHTNKVHTEIEKVHFKKRISQLMRVEIH